MKYYSDLTKKLYDSEEGLKEAEKAYNDKIVEQKKKDEERKADFNKVKEAYELAETQKKAADELMQEFLKKYKGVHETTDTARFIDVKQYMNDQKELISFVLGTFPFIF